MFTENTTCIEWPVPDAFGNEVNGSLTRSINEIYHFGGDRGIDHEKFRRRWCRQFHPEFLSCRTEYSVPKKLLLIHEGGVRAGGVGTSVPAENHRRCNEERPCLSVCLCLNWRLSKVLDEPLVDSGFPSRRRGRT